MKKIFLIILGITLITNLSSGQQLDQKPVKIGIAGLSHSHVLPLLRNFKNQDFQIVGISESNHELAI
jgi:tRNA A37 threonylcarbamoyladenosine dehydratase